MTEAERKAMEWLDWVIELHDYSARATPALTIKAMLAGAGYHAAPKTKEVEVEVWHVEWSDGDIPHTDDPYLQREHAERGADRRRVEGRGQCIRVTGPHKHRVSA